MAKTCTCGAALDRHPASGYSEAGACLKALEASSVKTVCDWLGCGKQVRKLRLGRNFCAAHRKLEWDASMSIFHLEGPQTLNRPLPTLEELAEFVRTKRLPASRLVPVTFATTKVQCATCHGPLIVVNDPDWSPELPNCMSTRADGSAWGIGICRACTLGHKVAASA